jgi:sigma-E factor negative regulatory protein RseA
MRRTSITGKESVTPAVIQGSRNSEVFIDVVTYWKNEMDTHKKIREHISSFADGASPAADVELALAALQGDDGRRTWALYHTIGDLLRGDPGPPLSNGFAATMAARLAQEPAPAKCAAGPDAPVVTVPAASA